MKRKQQKRRRHCHLFVSVEELQQLFAEIDNNKGSAANKNLTVLKEQVRVRKKLLNQKVPIIFTHLKKKRPLSTLAEEFKEFINANTPSDHTNVVEEMAVDPFSLVGRHVYHRFTDESSNEKWYEGYILGYNASTRLHEIAYVEEEDKFHYDLMDDLLAGDLKFNEYNII